MMVNFVSTPLLFLLMTVPRMGSGDASEISCAYVTTTASPTLKSSSGARKPAIFTSIRATASRRTASITSDARLNVFFPLLRGTAGAKTDGGSAAEETTDADAAAMVDDARVARANSGACQRNDIRGLTRGADERLAAW